MAENFVQVRFESKKANGALGMVLHNTRKIKPSYLRENEFTNKFSNSIYIFSKDEEFEQFDMTDGKVQTKVNNLLKQQLNDELEQVKTDTRNFREKKHALVQDSVITLSNAINQKIVDGEISKEKLEKLFLQAVRNLEKKLGLKALNMSIHWIDEKTPHAHVSYKNYYNGKSIKNDLMKNYVKSQDLVGEVFGEIGFVRGISKEITHAKHKDIVEMHEAEILELEQKRLVISAKNEAMLKKGEEYREGGLKAKEGYLETVKLLKNTPEILEIAKEELKAELSQELNKEDNTRLNLLTKNRENVQTIADKNAVIKNLENLLNTRQDIIR